MNFVRNFDKLERNTSGRRTLNVRWRFSQLIERQAHQQSDHNRLSSEAEELGNVAVDVEVRALEEDGRLSEDRRPTGVVRWLVEFGVGRLLGRALER